MTKKTFKHLLEGLFVLFVLFISFISLSYLGVTFRNSTFFQTIFIFLFVSPVLYLSFLLCQEELGKNLSKSKSKEDFYNQLYVCREKQCDVKFFRVYQTVEGIIERDRGPVGFFTQSYWFDLEKEWFEKNKVCPTCLSGKIDKVEKEFDWMKKIVDFPWLDYKSLDKRRQAFHQDFEKLRRKIEEVKELIEEKESIESFQWHYELDAEKFLDEDILSTKKSIIEQLVKIKEMNRHVVLHDEIDLLIKRLNLTPEELYEKNIKKITGIDKEYQVKFPYRKKYTL